MSDEQISLPGFGKIYPSVARDRERGPVRYRRRLMFLACLELRSGDASPHRRNQEFVSDLTREIHLRHYPKEVYYEGVPVRTMRRDDVCHGMHRKLKGLSKSRLKPQVPGSETMGRSDLLDLLAKSERKIETLQERLEKRDLALAVVEAQLALYAAQFGPLAVQETAE